MKRIRLVCILTALIIAVSSPVFAGLNYSGDSGKLIVTATRIGQLDYKLADNVTVITQEQIEDSNAHTVAELLTQTTGINVYDFGNAKSSIIDIRGFGETAPSNVLVLINDHKINSVDLSGPDLSRVPIESIDRIEIIRGAGSVLYGDNAVGGVVNIITKEGEGDLSGRAGITYDSFASKGTDVEASGEKNNISYYLYSRYLDKHGYRKNSDILAKDFNTRLGYDLTNRIKTDFNVMWHEDHVGLPGGLSDSQLQTDGYRAAATPDDFAKTTDRSFNLSLDVNPWPEDMYFGKMVFDILYRNRDVYDIFSGSPANRRIDTTGVSGKYIFDRTIFSKEVNFVTGFDLYDNRNPIKGEGSNLTDIIIRKNEAAAYGFLEYELFPHLFLNGGTRYQEAKYIFDDRRFHTYNTKSPDEWVSTGGAKYEYAPGSSVHASAQQTFRFPVTDEFYSSFNGAFNLDLKEQTGTQYEAGIKHNFDNKIVAHVTPYYMEFDNEIFFNPQSTNSNIDKTRRVGVEVGQEANLLKFVDIDFFNKLKLLTNYNYQDPEITDGPFKDKVVPFVPKHQTSAGLSATFSKYYNFSFMGRYVGKRFRISDFGNEAPQMKPYYTLDTKIAYERENWDIYMGIDNLTDYRYIGATVYAGAFGNFHYPSPGRMYTFGTNVKF
jgi:iron complex outermembrane recepter protein